MLIELENDFAVAVEATDAELDWLRETLSVSEKQFRKNYRTGRIEMSGTRRVSMILPNGKFPAGFTRLIWDEAPAASFDVEVLDKRRRPDVEIEFNGIDYLRDYQRDSVKAIVERGRGVVHAATGAGKTVVACAAAEVIPVQWMFFVQQKDLLHQTAAKYKEFTGRQASIIGDGRTELHDTSNLTVATVQTLNSRRDDKELWRLVEQAEGIILDECHAAPARTVWRVIMRTPNAYWRIGLSGTPFDRGDQKGLLTIGALGPTIHRVTAYELIRKGYLSKARITMTEVVQQSNRPTYQGVYGELIVRSSARNRALVQLMKNAAKPNLTFVKEIAHGQLLVKQAERAGLSVEFVWGSHSSEARSAAVKRLVRGDIECIVSSPVFQQGVDIPELRSIVVGSAGKSVIQTLQRIGRGMRISEGKDSFEVFDVLDRGNRWLEDHARKRVRSYEREGHQVNYSKPQVELEV